MSTIATADASAQLKQLVEEHKKIEGETLLLAVHYRPDRDTGDLFLFEVIEDFGAGDIDEDREFFEIAYASSASFPIQNGGRLHLVLTNPQEFEAACKENWALLAEVREAVNDGRSVTLYVNPSRPDLETKLRG